MASFDYIAWGNNIIVGKWVIETGESGIYRGQCTQVVSQLLKNLSWPSYAAARGNGNQVGANMVANGEAVYVGTNLTTIPDGEIHVVCFEVGNPNTAGHVCVAAAGDVIYEQNVTIAGAPTRNYGIGTVYPGRLGRLGESWRSTRYHYKLTIATPYDNVTGTGGTGTPTDSATGPNQNRFMKDALVLVNKSKTNRKSAVKTHKDYEFYDRTIRGISQA